jgi:carbon monoxide dehydrogenase subunit G
LKSNNGNSITIKKNGRGILAEMTVAAEPDRAWNVLTSFEEMSAHLSGFSKSKVLKTEDNYRLVEQTARVGIPLLSFSFRVVMSVVEDRRLEGGTGQASDKKYDSSKSAGIGSLD